MSIPEGWERAEIERWASALVDGSVQVGWVGGKRMAAAIFWSNTVTLKGGVEREGVKQQKCQFGQFRGSINSIE